MPSNHLILCCPLLLPPSTFWASGSFPMNQFFISGAQSIRVSASAWVLPMNIQDLFLLGWTGWLSYSQRLSRVFSVTTVQKYQFFRAQLSLWSNSHIHIWLLKKTALTTLTFVNKVISLLFNLLSKLVITFLPRSKHLWTSWLQSPSAVIWETTEIKSVTVSIFSPSCLPWSDGTECHDLCILNVEF